MEKAAVISTAPTNIAIIKYWGKKPEFENYFIPTKSSASFTVDKFYTTTNLEVKKGKYQILFELNNKKILPSKEEFFYISNFFERLAKFIPQLKNYSYSISSVNNFPTAAGFASSASGFAALSRALACAMNILEPKIFEKFFSTDEKISAIARLGSGSAARSIPQKGGFVLWKRGFDFLGPKPTDLDLLFCSYAHSLFDFNFWKELKIIYLALAKKEKKIKSRIGMQQSLATSPFYSQWVEYEEKILLPSLLEAINSKNFENFAKITSAASNSLHAIMLSTSPPLIYLNQKSLAVINLIEELNKEEILATYTFDAGPNPVIFTLQKNEKKVLDTIKKVCPSKNIFIQNIGQGSSCNVKL
ncbi:MAG: diphosphomevalonate decarboxylase [Candidatus Micrarchaeota archaeon]|nr:diphosphomevalonate decarboxylase [Candidatus Micrarchaeota archaeon]